MKKRAITKRFPELTSHQLINISGGNNNPLNFIDYIFKSVKGKK